MRLFISVLATTAIFLAASAASAVTFTASATSASGDALDALQIGDTVTIDIRVTADGNSVTGLGASVFGYDDDGVAAFASGEAVGSIFHAVAIPGVGAFTGLNSIAAGSLVESAIGDNGNRVQIFNGVGLSEFTDQQLDPGLDGVVGGGDAQFRVVLDITGAGAANILIGTGYEGDTVVLAGGVAIDANAATISLTAVPEPGTALLMGLGLAGLAGVGRR